MHKDKKSLLISAISLILCAAMLMGTTYAYFSDFTASNDNIVQSGGLDIDMLWTVDLENGPWVDTAKAQNEAIFSYDRWEPGYTEVRYFKIQNKGDLAFKYSLQIVPNQQVTNLSDVIDVYYVENPTTGISGRRDLLNLPRSGVLTEVINGTAPALGVLLPKDADTQGGKYHAGELTLAVALKMQESAGNEYQGKSIGGTFTVQLYATQFNYEEDTFGSDYDSGATLPSVDLPDGFVNDGASEEISVENNLVQSEVTLSGSSVEAVVPAGVAVEENTTALTLSVSSKENTEANISLNENETVHSLDVHIDGVAADNTKPMTITLRAAAAKGLNEGNLELYHVEDGNTVKMAYVASGEFTAHNQFKYDPATGDVVLYMASFSEVAVVSDTENKWNGTIATAFAGGSGTEADPYIIANADQLAYLGDRVSNDNANYGSAHYKLISDINMGGESTVDENGKLQFYPIGYTGEGYKGAFTGTFDGAGHRISNIFQNTWMLVGTYDGTYYNAAMGLFGYVNGGTVKNLTVDHFSSDGEFTPTGVIAAYADGDSTFANIAITNCNPRVYNTGNGGIIGIAGDTSAANDDHITLTNITVDNSNKISALWGSWDVACGGLVGMYRGNVDSNGNATGDTISFNNCHVAAQIDVYNDVCANYQYYAYRYAGMMIGSIRHNTTNADGKTIPNMAGISATGCTVNYGDWNDYYYCEFEKNSMASYSEDYQFSRVPHSELKFTDSNGNGVVDADERASVTGCKHTHTANEDKQAVYLPFHQLFTGYSWGVSSIGLEELEGIQNITVTIGKEESVVKFNCAFPDSAVDEEGNVQTKFLYRVGNKNAVRTGTLFEALNGVDIEDSGVYVSVTSMDNDLEVMGSYTTPTNDLNGDGETNWKDGSIRFSETGPVKVTIQDYQYCEPTVLYLEVVDGYNVAVTSENNRTLTGWTSDGSNVLIENVEIASGGTLILQNGTLYGNGFELDASNAAYSGVEMDYQSYAISVKNARMDNITINGAVYPSLGTTKEDDYFRPLLFVTGDEKCTFINSYLSGTASPIRSGCDLELVNVTLDGGLYANLDMRGGNLVLDNVTTINQGSSTNAFGMGIVVYQEGGSEDMSITVKNTLKQYNFISKSHAEKLSGYAAMVVNQMFQTEYSQYQFTDENGECWVNSGIISMNNLFDGKEDIIDQREVGHGYSGKAKTVNLGGQTRDCYVYTFMPNADDLTGTPTTGANGQNVIVPKVEFNHAVNNVAATDDAPNDYCTADGDIVTISMDLGDSAFGWKPTILNATKSGKTLAYTATVTADGSSYVFDVAADGAVTATKNGAAYEADTIPFGTVGEYIVTYSYTDPYNFSVNEDGSLVSYKRNYTKYLTVKVFVVEPDAKHAEFSFGANGTEYKSKVVSVTKTDGSIRNYVMPEVSATVDGKIGSTTVEGEIIYYPITEMYTSDGKTAHTGSWYACFPIFKDAVQIIDYADKGTGDAVTYNQTNVTTVEGIPSTLKATNPTSAFLYQMNATNYPPPTDPTAVSSAVCYTCNRNGLTSGNTREEMTILAEYMYTDNIGTAYYYYVGYHCAEQTKGSSFPCVTPDTLISLADGTQKEIQYVRVGDEVLVWNFYTGKYEVMPVSLLQAHSTGVQNVLHLYFEDGTELKILGEHGVFDADLKTFVFIDEYDVQDYVGHCFVKQDGEGFKTVRLVGYEVTTEHTTAYTILSGNHYNVLAEGMFTVTPSHVGDNFFNPFDIGEDMKYEEEAVKADIEKYGLYTYEDFDHVLTYEQFTALNLGHFKVSVGKGYVTYDGLIYLIENFVNNEDFNR